MLNDLIFVLKYIKTILEEYNLPDTYSQFAATLQQISSSSTPELQKALKDYKIRIKEAHERLEPVGWTYSQVNFFRKFGAANHLGKAGWNKFQLALSDNSANTPGAVEQINIQRSEIAQLLTNATNIISSLGNLAQELEIEKGKSIIQIVFDEDVAVDTFIDLFDQSKDWKEIIRAFSLLAGEAPEKTKIIATSKGSPYTIWLSSARFVGETLCATIKPFIELYKTVLEAKEKALLLEDMKVGVDGKKFELFKAIDEYERDKVMEIVASIGEINNNGNISESERNEAKIALTKVGPRLYEFITKGGKIDVSKEEGNRKAFSNFQLEVEYQETKKLESRVQKLLETRKPVEKAQEEKESQPPQTNKTADKDVSTKNKPAGNTQK